MGKHAGKIAILLSNIEAMKSDEKGKPIQYELKNNGGWIDSQSPSTLSWILDECNYREKPFEPEVGKFYMFSDDTRWFIGKLEHIADERVFMYRTDINGAGWKYCRPLTEEEIGK